jgi:peptidoglycan/LPS O-acetylase OafA/YrhL
LRVAYLDGLRGIASLQVLALHFFSAFLPALGQIHPELARHRWESAFIHTPLFYFADGYASVYLFFLISGAALTYAFSRHPFALVSGVARRTVRLGVPMAASMLLAFALFALMPDARVTAGHLVGEGAWLHLSGPPSLTLRPLLWEMLEGLFLGHVDLPCTLLPHAVATWLDLTPVAYSFNGPIWTLHIEFAGSILIMLLVALRAGAPRAVHRSIALVLAVLLIAHPLGLFVIGHLAAPIMARPAACRSAFVGFVLFLCGMACASYAAPDWLLGLPLRWAAVMNLPADFDGLHLQSAAEAIFIFAAVAVGQPLRTLLTTGPVQTAGRLSFSLYLVHFPILLTIACVVFTWTYGGPAASAIAIAAGVVATVGLAFGFERWVDRPAIALSHRIGRTLLLTRGVADCNAEGHLAPMDSLSSVRPE